jgi:thiosulfate/3-mercaptopyruvate sulfurtransferase
VDEQWKYKNDEELMEVFNAKGVDWDKEFVTSCGSGLTAAMISFSAHLLGKEKGYLYDMSWAEYGKIEK